MKSVASSLFALILILLAVTTSFAQEWGVVTDAEWKMGPPAEYPNAGAVIVFDIGLATTELRGLDFKRHTRIKVFDKSLVDEIKTVRIEYYDYDKVYDVKAQMIKPDGRVIEFNEDDFEKTSKGSLVERQFTFANIENGDILEYSYGIEYYGGLEKLGPEKYFLFSQDKRYGAYMDRKKGVVIDDKYLERNVSNILPWFFDHPVFCLSSVFTAKLGSDLDYVFCATNLPEDRIDPVVDEVVFITAVVYKKYTWALENIHPYPKDPSSPYPNETIRMGLHFQLFSTVNGQNRILRGTYTDEHWQHLGESFQGYLQEYVKTSKKMRKKTRELVKNAADTLSMVEAIYNFVSSELEPDSTGHVLRPSHNNLKKLYDDGSGMPFEINILLEEMLKIAGVQTYPVIISTRDKIDFRKSAQFNHILAVAVVDGRNIFMDASVKGCPLGSLPPLSNVDEGLLVDYSDSHVCKIEAELCR